MSRSIYIGRLTGWKTEKEFNRSVFRLAEQFGWLSYTTFASVFSAKGFPDLVLVHPARKRVIFAELKMPKGKLTDYQKNWKEKLIQAGAEYYLWRPDDWDSIIYLLTDGTA